jgi:hypothetical protein
MNINPRLAFCLIAALGSGVASAQTDAAASVAYVYISAGTSNYVYKVSPAGSLTAIKGSPFTTAGNMIGSNGS